MKLSTLALMLTFALAFGAGVLGLVSLMQPAEAQKVSTPAKTDWHMETVGSCNVYFAVVTHAGRNFPVVVSETTDARYVNYASDTCSVALR